LLGATSRLSESLFDLDNLLLSQSLWLGVCITEWNIGRSKHLVWPSTLFNSSDRTLRCLVVSAQVNLNPRSSGATFTARMGQLDADNRPLRMNEVDDTLELRNMFVGPDAVIFWTDASFGNHSRCFDANRSDAMNGEALEVGNK